MVEERNAEAGLHESPPPPDTPTDAEPQRTPRLPAVLRAYLPLGLSVFAALFSTWTWYYGSYQDRRGLTAIPKKLAIPFWTQTFNPPGRPYEIQASLLIINKGNRAAAVIGYGMFVWDRSPDMSVSMDKRCLDDDHARLFADAAAAGRAYTLPARAEPESLIVAPGGIERIDIFLDARKNWQALERKVVDACLSLRTVDDAGVIRTSVFPLAEVDYELDTKVTHTLREGPWELF